MDPTILLIALFLLVMASGLGAIWPEQPGFVSYIMFFSSILAVLGFVFKVMP